ncbi:recombinase family protein [Novosphingobium tardum]|uniref:Recombinase family protein n=1 Tax=Novosphingobium tardum TaxID=1538021 RepID=A0ABV8RLB4_9SPHN
MRHFFAMPKVYSYIRFSTPEQARGDSFRRQAAAAKAFAAEQGLELDDTLQITDAGVSAYRGANLSADAGLGKFMAAVQLGLVEPGSVLALESLDRFSRMEPLDVQFELTALIRAGIAVATLSDGHIYSRESLKADGGLGLVVSVMSSGRGYEESRIKSTRLAGVWAEKRRKVRAGEAAKLTSRAPAWLRWQEPAGWSVDEARAAIVRRVYALTLAGEGEHMIAQRFNREGVPPLGRAKLWHRSSVSKLLRNPAVIGELTPGQIEYQDGVKRRVLEEPIPGAFPAIIVEPDWLAVRSLKDGHAPAARGQGAKRPLANVLAGLARCPICGSAMTRVQKGNPAKGGQPKLVCTRAKAGAGCVYHSVPLGEVERAVFAKPAWFVDNIPAGDGGRELDREAQSARNTIAGLEDHLGELGETLEQAPSVALARRLASLEAEIGTHKAALADLEERRRLTDGGLIHARAVALGEAIEERGEADRAAINAALKVLFDAVVVDYRAGELRLHWRQGGVTPMLFSMPPAPGLGG